MWITNATYPKVYVKPERHFQRRFGLPSLGPTTHKYILMEIEKLTEIERKAIVRNLYQIIGTHQASLDCSDNL